MEVLNLEKLHINYKTENFDSNFIETFVMNNYFNMYNMEVLFFLKKLEIIFDEKKPNYLKKNYLDSFMFLNIRYLFDKQVAYTFSSNKIIIEFSAESLEENNETPNNVYFLWLKSTNVILEFINSITNLKGLHVNIDGIKINDFLIENPNDFYQKNLIKHNLNSYDCTNTIEIFYIDKPIFNNPNMSTLKDYLSTMDINYVE